MCQKKPTFLQRRSVPGWRAGRTPKRRGQSSRLPLRAIGVHQGVYWALVVGFSHDGVSRNFVVAPERQGSRKRVSYRTKTKKGCSVLIRAKEVNDYLSVTAEETDTGSHGLTIAELSLRFRLQRAEEVILSSAIFFRRTLYY